MKGHGVPKYSIYFGIVIRKTLVAILGRVCTEGWWEVCKTSLLYCKASTRSYYFYQILSYFHISSFLFLYIFSHYSRYVTLY